MHLHKCLDFLKDMTKKAVALFFSLAVFAALGQTEIEKLEAEIKPLKEQMEKCFQALETTGASVDESLRKLQSRTDLVNASASGPVDEDYLFFKSEGERAANAMRGFSFELGTLGRVSEFYNKVLAVFSSSARLADTPEKQKMLSRLYELRTWREQRITALQILNERRIAKIRTLTRLMESYKPSKA